MDPLHYVLTRMQELKPRYDELAAKPELDDNERAEYQRTTEEWDGLNTRRVDLEERQARALAAGSINFNINTLPDPFKADLGSMSRSDVVGAAKTAVSDIEKRFAKREHGENVTRLIERADGVGETAARLALTTGTPEYRDAWINAMTGRAFDERVLKRAQDEYRTMTAGTGGTGGFMVPLMLDPTMVITGAGSANPFRRVSNVKQINTLTYNGATAAEVTAGLLTENGAFTDVSPTVSQVQIATYKIGAYIPASFEAFEDIDALAGDVLELFSDARDNYEATQFTTGTGSAPHGVVGDVGAVTASRVSPATGGAYAAADMFTLHSALPARYRYMDGDSRAFIASVNTIDKTRQFATANAYYAFLTDATTGAPPRLLGDQLLEASAMSSSYTTGQDVLLYGDFRKFYIIDRIGMSAEFIPNVFNSSGLPTGTRAWLMHWRVGSAVADTGAFRLLRL